MDDIELAYGASTRIGDLYREAKTFGGAIPAYAVTQLRGLASLYCDFLDKNFTVEELAVKIKSLDQRGLLKSPVRRHLRTLQLNGNKGAHPEKYPFEVHDFPQLAKGSVEAALNLVESMYVHRQGAVPTYSVVDVANNGLKDLCYRALIEADLESVHLLGVYFKEKADQLKQGESWLLQDGYGPASRADIDKAMFWFKQGAEQRHPDCMYRFGFYLAESTGENPQRADGERLISAAATAGHADALVYLANCYLDGSDVFIKDEAQALVHYELAALQEHPEAFSQLGALYALGRGCERDDTKARSYSIRAAEMGSPLAQFNLFVLYRTGQGVDASLSEALKWLVDAADQGHPSAINSLAIEIQAGSFPDRPLTDALEYFERSIAWPEFRSRAALNYAALWMQLDDSPAGWEKAAKALQQCYEAVSDDDKHHDLMPYCLARAKKVVSKLRAWFAANWLKGFQIETLLVCTLYSRDYVPVVNKKQRLADLGPMIQRTLVGSDFQKQQALIELLGEGGVVVGNSASAPQAGKTICVGKKVGRNERCPCNSGSKFKHCHGA